MLSYLLILLCLCFPMLANCNNNILSFERGSQELMDQTDRAREALTNNLIRFREQGEPVALNFPDNDADNLTENLKLTNDSVTSFLHFLSPRDLKNLTIASPYYGQMKNYPIANKLANFSKYYVFEDHWLNAVMYEILKDHFPDDMNLNHPDIYDHVEIMTLKYINGVIEMIDAVPRYIYFACMTFIHETVYGTNFDLISSMIQWRIDFAIKIQLYNLPLTLDYLVDMKPKCRGRFQQSSYLKIVNFLAKKPSLSEKAAFNLPTPVDYFKSFDLVMTIDFKATEMFDDFQSKAILEHVSFNNVHRIILNRISLSEELRSWFILRFDKGISNSWFYRHFFFNFQLPIHDLASYIFSRDLTHPFDLEEAQTFQEFDPVSLFNIIVPVEHLNLPYLVFLDMITKIIRSGLLRLEDSPFVDCEVFRYGMDSDLPIADLMILEYPVLVNFMDTPNFFNLNNFRAYAGKFKMTLALETLCQRNNPLAAVFLLGLDVTKYADKITSRFNLNVSYHFDYNVGLNNLGVFFNVTLVDIFGRIMTFRQILKRLNRPEISATFGLLTEQDFFENEEAKQLYPVHSLAAYIQNPNSII